MTIAINVENRTAVGSMSIVDGEHSLSNDSADEQYSDILSKTEFVTFYQIITMSTIFVNIFTLIAKQTRSLQLP